MFSIRQNILSGFYTHLMEEKPPRSSAHSNVQQTGDALTALAFDNDRVDEHLMG